jgi:cell division protein FtsB
MSFSDLMSSGRGPGVIGMLMALVVLIGFGFLFMFAMDEGTGEKSIQSVIAQQRQDIESYKASFLYQSEALEKAPARIAEVKELARLKRENQFLQENIGNLQKGIAAGKAELVRKNGEFEAYKDQYRAFARAQAKGEAMETLATVTGAVYKSVNIREVTAIGIQIRHAEGHKRIPFEELPDAMKDRFQFDPKQKEKAIAEESVERDKHEAAVGVASIEEEKLLAKQRQLDAEGAKEKLRRDIAAKQSLISSIQQEISALEGDMQRAEFEAASARSSGNMHINKSSGISGNIRSKQNRIAALQAEVAQMNSRL